MAQSSNIEDDKKVDILLQRDQTIAEVCSVLCTCHDHMYCFGSSRGC